LACEFMQKKGITIIDINTQTNSTNLLVRRAHTTLLFCSQELENYENSFGVVVLSR